MKFYSLLIVLAVMLGLASAAQNTKQPLARVGSSTIDQPQYESFQKIIRMYPTKQNDYFPAQRSMGTHIVETEILFSKATPELKSKLEKTLDWQWKKAYYPAQIYLIEKLGPDLGINANQIEDYYHAHKESFKVTVAATDSLKKDSVYYKEISEVKGEIIDSLFLQSDKPDSVFLKSLGDSLPPQNQINQSWIGYVRSNPPKYFMKKFYNQDFGKPFPDSLNEIFGEGKIITQADMDIILSWIPQERREYYSNAEGKRELVEWLLKWKLFSKHAEKSGFTSQPSIKKDLEWAWRIEVVSAYVDQVLLPKVKAVSDIDTMIVKYAITDEAGTPNLNPDTAELNRKIAELKRQSATLIIDSLINRIRKAVPVTYLKDDLRDEKMNSPAKLIAKADKLRDSGKTEEAENLYTTLARDFAFTSQGKRAIIEIAKIQTERQAYYQAIANYRKYLLSGDDKSKFCNVFFMIGFIYDEYLDRPEMAEVNYKYVLKNLPGCELTDDAEFMMLHLGEPMSSVEELQAEALRQGRKIDSAENSTHAD